MQDILRKVRNNERVDSIEYVKLSATWIVNLDDYAITFQVSEEELDHALDHLEEYENVQTHN